MNLLNASSAGYDMAADDLVTQNQVNNNLDMAT